MLHVQPELLLGFAQFEFKYQPAKGFTVAQFGPTSLSVAGTLVSQTREESVSICSITSDEISRKGKELVFIKWLMTQHNGKLICSLQNSPKVAVLHEKHWLIFMIFCSSINQLVDGRNYL